MKPAPGFGIVAACPSNRGVNIRSRPTRGRSLCSLKLWGAQHLVRPTLPPEASTVCLKTAPFLGMPHRTFPVGRAWFQTPRLPALPGSFFSGGSEGRFRGCSRCNERSRYPSIFRFEVSMTIEIFGGEGNEGGSPPKRRQGTDLGVRTTSLQDQSKAHRQREARLGVETSVLR
eukprot:scaffold435_cov342-Pavlova_lutheri.AAC.8